MATIEQLSAALVKADAAGNTADAKAFADEIRRLRAVPPAPAPAVEPSRSEIPGPRVRPSLLGEFGQEFVNVGAGMVRGLGSIGATLIRPFESREENIARRAAISQGLQSLTGAEPESVGFKTGQFVGEVGPVLPVAGGMAAAVRGAARVAPATAPVLTPVAAALQTGGMGTRIPGRPLSTAALRVGAGAATGGAAAGLIDPETAATGALFGAAAPVVVPAVTKAVAKGAGALFDLGSGAYTKAGNFARSALGTDAAQTINALRAAGPGVSVAEATAGIQNPAWQALVRDSLEKTPEGAKYLNRLATLTDEQAAKELNQLAQGATTTERRAAQELQKQTVTDITSPARQAALTRANQGQRVAQLEAEAALLEGAAADKVAEVRKLIKAGEIAKAAARLDMVKKGLPVGLARYTYPAQLAQQADEWASQAATASLDLGQGARFARSAMDSLDQAGIKPLKTEQIIGQIASVARDPKAGVAGNDVLEGALRNVADDLSRWTNNSGVIDAMALESIRKNSVNAAIQRLRPGIDATAQKNLAASVMSRVRPLIDDAIESAGGAGWKQYLSEYSAGMRQIAESKLVGEAARLWKADKNGFVKLVQGESPEVVERILGPGSYDIAKELADDTVQTLSRQANRHLARVAAEKQASEGGRALSELIQQNTSKFRVINPLNFYAAITNRVIADLEKAVGAKSVKILSDAMQSPQAAADLLEALPANERVRVLRLLENPELWAKRLPAAAGAIAGATTQPTPPTNSLAPEAPANALAR